MERIGIAASKMAKGNLVLYNFYVLAIAFLIALILFLIAGGAVFLALLAIGSIAERFIPGGLAQEWMALIRICMVSLTLVISLTTLALIVRNVKFR